MKGIIIYQSKYGATKEYAHWISEALNIPCYLTSEVTPAQIEQSDYIIIGSPVLVGKLLIRKWLKKHLALLNQKKIFLFIVCGNDSQNVQEQQQILKGLPALQIGEDNVFFIKGRVVISMLSFRDRLLIRMGASLVKDPAKKQSMLQGMDGVHRENIKALLAAIEEYAAAPLSIQPVK